MCEYSTECYRPLNKCQSVVKFLAFYIFLLNSSEISSRARRSTSAERQTWFCTAIFFLLLLVDAPRRADESTKMRELHTHDTHNTLGPAAAMKCKSSRRWEENFRQTAIIMMNCIIGFLFVLLVALCLLCAAHQGSESVQCLKTETSNKFKRKWTGKRGELNEWSEYLCDFALVSLKFFIWLRAPHTCLRSKSTLNVKRYFLSLNIVFFYTHFRLACCVLCLFSFIISYVYFFWCTTPYTSIAPKRFANLINNQVKVNCKWQCSQWM